MFLPAQNVELDIWNRRKIVENNQKLELKTEEFENELSMNFSIWDYIIFQVHVLHILVLFSKWAITVKILKIFFPLSKPTVIQNTGVP